MNIQEGDRRNPGGGRGKDWNASPLQRAFAHADPTISRNKVPDSRTHPEVIQTNRGLEIDLSGADSSVYIILDHLPLELLGDSGLSPQSSGGTEWPIFTLDDKKEKYLTPYPVPRYFTPASGVALSDEQKAAGEYYAPVTAGDLARFFMKLPGEAKSALAKGIAAANQNTAASKARLTQILKETQFKPKLERSLINLASTIKTGAQKTAEFFSDERSRSIIPDIVTVSRVSADVANGLADLGAGVVDGTVRAAQAIREDPLGSAVFVIKRTSGPVAVGVSIAFCNIAPVEVQRQITPTAENCPGEPAERTHTADAINFSQKWAARVNAMTIRLSPDGSSVDLVTLDGMKIGSISEGRNGSSCVTVIDPDGSGKEVFFQEMPPDKKGQTFLEWAKQVLRDTSKQPDANNGVVAALNFPMAVTGGDVSKKPSQGTPPPEQTANSATGHVETATAPATPTAVHGEFHAQNWTGAPDISTNSVGVVWNQGSNTYHVVITDDSLSGTDWGKYAFSDWSPTHLKDIANATGVPVSQLVSQARGGISDFLNMEVNTDHHLDTQMAALSGNLANTDNVTFILGKGADGKIWVTNVVDNSDPQNVKTYTVNPDGTVKLESSPTAKPKPPTVALSTPLPENSPTLVPPTPDKNIIFASNFDSGTLEGWNNVLQQGAKVELVPDPTGSNRGEVLKASIAGQPQLDQGYYKRRGYPDWYDGGFGTNAKLILGPSSVSVDAYIDSSLYPGSSFHVSTLSFFSTMKGSNEPVFVGLMAVDLYNGKPVVSMDSPYPIQYAGADTTFRFNRWHTDKIMVSADGTLGFYQDGVLMATVMLPPNVNIGTIGGHAGLYSFAGTQPNGPDYPQGAFLLNDKFIVRVGQ